MTILPVFPLPDTVFFPHTVLPLHIFEPRYRQMIADVSESDGRLVVALMDGDDFHPIATVGTIRELNPLDDGRYILSLEGEARVELTELPSPNPYRLVRTEPREETAPAPSLELDRARIELVAAMGLLAREVRRTGGSGLVFDDRTPFATALNAVCSSLPVDALLRQELLEYDDLMDRHALATEHLDAVIEAVMRLRGLGSEPLEPSELN